MQTIRLSDCATHLAVHKGSNSWAAVMKPLKQPQATANLQQGARRTNHGIKESGMLFLYVQCGDLGCMHTMRQADVGREGLMYHLLSFNIEIQGQANSLESLPAGFQ